MLGVKKNALQVLIPKYGLEGALYLKDFPFAFDEQVGSSFAIVFVLNYKNFLISFKKEPSQTAEGVKLSLFEKIIVRISIETKNIQHQKMKLELVKPYVS